MNLRYPNITGATPAEQIQQLKGYLYQLVEQLNLGNDAAATAQIQSLPATGPAKSGDGTLQLTPTGMFNQIKSLIIKSADIVTAYSEEIQKDLSGLYVAQSDFGTYAESTNLQLQANSKNINALFDNVQLLQDQAISAKAYIKEGLLFYAGPDTLEQELGVELAEGTPVYGLEVGQEVEREGSKVFDTFARFTSYGATFYDQNRQLSAYITNKQFSAPNVKVEETFTRGGYVETIDSNGGRVERWVGI